MWRGRSRLMRMNWIRISCVWLLALGGSVAGVVPENTTQCLVGIAEDWGSSKARLFWFEKSNGKWVQSADAWNARLGRKGLAWGRGLHPNPEGATLKQEGDWKSPAGVFAIGGAWGYDPSIRKHRDLPYTRITSRHLWVEDPQSRHYNRQVVLDREPREAWEKKAQMRQNDPAHSLKLFIAHNAPPRVVKGGGSSIFFHIWRDQGGRPTAGCTVMDEGRLRWLISRIDPNAMPVYVLLTAEDYKKHQKAWGLPPIQF